MGAYTLDVATNAGIYVLLALGLNMVVGMAGLLVLGYIAFSAVGAYTYAILSTQMHLSFWLALPLGGAARGRASGSSWAFRPCACGAITWPS